MSHLTTRLVGLPPLLAPHCRLVILGSFPGVASLQAQQYYGHPRNNFWPLMMTVLPAPAGLTMVSSYEKRIEWLLSQRVGLWDVYAACEREGSLDSDIRHAHCNDFAELAQRCPELEAIAHNGGESYKHRHHTEGLRRSDGKAIAVYKLPSSSPANASWSFERKLAAWGAVIHPHTQLPATISAH